MQISVEKDADGEEDDDDKEVEEGMLNIAAASSKEDAATTPHLQSQLQSESQSPSPSQSDVPHKAEERPSSTEGLKGVVVQGSARRRSCEEFEDRGIVTEERAAKRRKFWS